MQLLRDERGFSMLEVLLTVTILGILAAIAVPKFSSVTAKANTAKVQTDLQTIDSAILLYEAEKGTIPGSVADLSDYITDAARLRPPQGTCFVRTATGAKEVTVDDTEYKIELVTNGGVSERRATCEGMSAGDFGK